MERLNKLLKDVSERCGYFVQVALKPASRADPNEMTNNLPSLNIEIDININGALCKLTNVPQTHVSVSRSCPGVRFVLPGFVVSENCHEFTRCPQAIGLL